MRRVNQLDLTWIEDILAVAGVYSICRDAEYDILNKGYRGDPDQLIGDPCLVAVLHSYEDIGRMHRVLRDNFDELRRRLGPDYMIGHEFWNYFLIYQEFARISFDSNNEFFLSVNITNSRDPRRIDAPTVHLSFDLRITMIRAQATAAEIETKRQEVRTLVNNLNQRSRFLKIGSVATSYVTTKFIAPGTPEPEFVNLPL